jgi:hypothetical protein
MITFSKENVLVLPGFLKNKYIVKKNLLALPALLENKYFVKRKSPCYVLIPENMNFVKGKSPSFAPSSLKGSINTRKSKILVLPEFLNF